LTQTKIRARRIVLASIPTPIVELDAEPPTIAAAEYADRVRSVRATVDADWIAVYGDREHFANLAYLCGFDPRFEEALMLIGDGPPVLAVGNEGLGYAQLVAVGVEILLCPAFSLPGQDRNGGPTLRDLLHEVGVATGHTVGVVGWKELQAEDGGAHAPIAAPAFIVDALRATVGGGRVLDATGALMSARHGQRTVNSATQLAAFEWAASRSATAVARIIAATSPGLHEDEAVAAMGYAGDPLTCHVMFSSGPEVGVGLRSPRRRKLELGDAVTTAVGFRGGLCCRAGLLAASPDESRPESDGYLERMAIPYWRAIASWYEALRLDATGDDLQLAVDDALAEADFEPALNPGHLVHLDEWVDSPVRRGSQDRVRSGMAWQCDIIPNNARPGWAANCEDTVAVADRQLRDQLASEYPRTWERIVARRQFMQTELGVALGDEVLPLSPLAARFSPFWLSSERALRFAD
jgi:hypothetical protein